MNLYRDSDLLLLKTTTVRHVRKGVIARLLCACISMLKEETYAAVDWRDDTYFVTNHSAAWGAVTFDGDECVAAFFEGKDERITMDSVTGRPISRELWTTLINGMPVERLRIGLLAGHAISSVLNAFDQCLTAIIWSERGELRWTGDIESTWNGGAHLLRDELSLHSGIADFWRGHYSLTAQEVEILDYLVNISDYLPCDPRVDVSGLLRPLVNHRSIHPTARFALSVLNRMGFTTAWHSATS